MHPVWVFLSLVSGVILSQVIARHARLPIELVLLLGSIVVSLIPAIPRVSLEPELAFFLFLPPILFAAAFFTSWRDFVRYRRPIARLAVGLVAFTTVTTAAILKLLVPEIPWAVAFLFGAIVSPPDASAATALTRKLKVPRSLLTIIEGESLVNDATALVCFRFALAAVMTERFDPGEALVQLVVVAAGGIVVGLTIARAFMALLRRLEEPNAETLLTFLTAFVAYAAAESLHVSGVISTVAAGLHFGRSVPRYGSVELRMRSQAVWDAVLLAINGMVFTLIGLQLPFVIRHLQDYGLGQLFVDAAVVCAAVIGVRFIWIFGVTWLLRILGFGRSDESPSWQSMVILGWTGMRGIVSLAAALSIPVLLETGAPFPHRSLILFLTYAVILVTLILPTLTLPWLTRKLDLHGEHESEHEEARARIEMARAGARRLEQMFREDGSNRAIIGQWLDRYRHQLEILEPNLLENAFSAVNPEDIENRRVALAALDGERARLQELRTGGALHDEVFHNLLREIDREEVRFRESSRVTV